MQPDSHTLNHIIATALAEDIGRGDLTSQLTISPHLEASFTISSREPITVCGAKLAMQVFHQVDSMLQLAPHSKEGEQVKAGAVILEGKGNARAILTAERTALNFLQHLSGISTLTRRYVEAVHGTGVKILDTRKTTPGLRDLEKYAVRCGGGRNHRIRLDDGVLIKDNHISVAGGIVHAVERARAGTPLLTCIEVECDTLEQVKQALAADVDMILLDNMTPHLLREAVRLVNGQVPLEASGNMSLETIRAVAETGVDYISIGRLTHSAPNVDIGLEMVIQK